MKKIPKYCEAEDQGGYQCCPNPPFYQTKDKVFGKRWYYCKDHKINRHVWEENEVEPIPEYSNE